MIMSQGRYVKRMMQLLLSISVLSFIISISSWVCFGFQSLRFCVATLPVQLINHSINRNCIFLVCNGLLVFIANSSGLIPDAYVSQPTSRSLTHPSNKDTTTKNLERDEEDREDDQEAGNDGMLEKIVVDKEVVMVHAGDDDSSFKKWLLFDTVKMENPVIHENEDMKKLSMDEVNRRFDEFILKIKEEIRLEASNQQQLLLLE